MTFPFDHTVLRQNLSVSLVPVMDHENDLTLECLDDLVLANRAGRVDPLRAAHASPELAIQRV